MEAEEGSSTRVQGSGCRPAQGSGLRRELGARLVYGGGGAEGGLQRVVGGLRHLEGHIEQVLVEEVHQLGAQAVRRPQPLAGCPATQPRGGLWDALRALL